MSPDSIAHFQRELLLWYHKCGRKELPWRNTVDPYPIYVSEVMLQQTQVKTVLERFYFPFLEAFPTLQKLASAPQKEVLNYWQGLGYYNRAINLHKTAQLCPNGLPDNAQALLELPGIGQNTAHAILAFAFHQPVAIMEANVKRVLHRIFAFKTAKPAELWQSAETLLNTQKPFDHNQAMMDLGSMICTPKNPACDACPANTICKGKSTPLTYPEPKTKKQIPTRKKHIVILQDTNRKIWMRPRVSRFLNGLYQFAQFDETKQPENVPDSLGVNLHDANKLGAISHTYSHFKLQADVYHLNITQAMNHPEWHDITNLDSVPLSKAEEKALSLFSASSALQR
ncbi:MAG: A/G-specific adenine glycosylase [Rickettsiales bacterium]|nr:A/G-specific adenine glycosylase [Rickettsiales bacterium]